MKRNWFHDNRQFRANRSDSKKLYQCDESGYEHGILDDGDLNSMLQITV